MMICVKQLMVPGIPYKGFSERSSSCRNSTTKMLIPACNQCSGLKAYVYCFQFIDSKDIS